MIEAGVFGEYFNAIDRNTLKITDFNHFGPWAQILKNTTIRQQSPCDINLKKKQLNKLFCCL